MDAPHPDLPIAADIAVDVLIDVDADTRVSGLALSPPSPRAACVLGHGAGAGMAHPFMAGLASGLAARGIATLRYQFAYMERGSKRPDSPKVAHAVVRAAAAAAAARWPGLPLVAGGKSFGGRMTSQAEAAAHLPGVAGLVFFGFPLHPADQPGIERAEHLDRVALPMLFLQGTRDELAALTLLEPVVERLAPRSTLRLYDDADHAFHVRARSGSNDAAVLAQMLDAAAAWIDAIADPERTHPAAAATAAWLDAAVVGLDLCPFAKAVRARGAVRIAVSRAAGWAALRADLASELARLVGADPAALETTLIVCPDLPAGFDDFNQFLDDADDALRELDLEGVIQIASFHPDYRFADTEADDITNATNRSPHATLHLLRESSVERAVDAYGDTDAIFEANMARLRALGSAGWERLRAAWIAAA